MVSRAHFGPIPISRVEISIDEPQYRWMREHGTLHIPDVRAQNDFPTLGSVSQLSHLLGRSPSSAGGTHWNTERTSHRGASLHPGADQTARNLRRPGGHRHRERAAVSRTARTQSRITELWSSRRRRVKFWASSPARRPTFSRCWMLLRRTQRGYVTRPMPTFTVLTATGYRLVASYGAMPIPDRDKPRPLIRGHAPARAMIDRAVVHVDDMLSLEAQAEFPEGWAFTQAVGLRTMLSRTVAARGGRNRCDLDSPHGSSPIHRTSRLRFSKPSPTKR